MNHSTVQRPKKTASKKYFTFRLDASIPLMHILLYQEKAIPLSFQGSIKMSNKVYEVITSKIISSIEADGILPWRKPFSIGSTANIQRNYISKKPYQGINAILTTLQIFPSPFWITFKQAESISLFIKKGEKGTPIIYWNWIADKEDPTKKIPFARYFTVFNVSQFKDWEKVIIQDTVKEELNILSTIEKGEFVKDNYKNSPKIDSVDAGKACYIPAKDQIIMPPLNRFEKSEEYYSTLFHEMIHSTGHESRLNRKGITKTSGFGSDPYAFEELIAEIGSAFLCNHSEIEGVYDNSVSYISSWNKRFKEDVSILPKAANAAMKAANHILGIVPIKHDDSEVIVSE